MEVSYPCTKADGYAGGREDLMFDDETLERAAASRADFSRNACSLRRRPKSLRYNAYTRLSPRECGMSFSQIANTMRQHSLSGLLR